MLTPVCPTHSALSTLSAGLYFVSAPTSAGHTVPGTEQMLSKCCEGTCSSACGLECTPCRLLSPPSHLLFLTPKEASGPGETLLASQLSIPTSRPMRTAGQPQDYVESGCWLTGANSLVPTAPRPQSLGRPLPPECLCSFSRRVLTSSYVPDSRLCPARAPRRLRHATLPLGADPPHNHSVLRWPSLPQGPLISPAGQSCPPLCATPPRSGLGFPQG